MIKTYLVVFVFLIIGKAFSQEIISFEVSEGYTLGTLNTQNGWEVTDDNEGGFLLNQLITDEQATDGLYAFKNAYEPSFNFQWLPIFGAVKTFDVPKTFDNFSFSYDVMVTEANGADFELTLYGIDANSDYVPVAGVAMEYQGLIYVIEDINYGYHYIDGATWTPNTWLNVKIEVSPTELKYYLNNTLAYTDVNFTTSPNIVGFNMLHNNYGGDAYYDNFIISDNALSMDNFSMTSDFQIFPNPVQDELRIQGANLAQISQVSIYNLQGQKIMESETTSTLNVSSLSTGIYMLKIDTLDSKTHTHKLVKK